MERAVDGVAESDGVIEKLRDRDATYLTRLFEDLNPYLIRISAGHGFFGEHAEELIHQTWETFFTQLDRFEGRSHVKTFVVGILINKVREARRALRKIVLDEDPESILESRFTPEGWWKQPPEDPSRLLETSELGAFLRECIEGLNEAQRSAFLLVEVEGENSRDICNILNVTATHLRVLLFRAKEKLRLCMVGKL